MYYRTKEGQEQAVARARSEGYNLGCQDEKKAQDQNIDRKLRAIRPDFMMSVQRLAEANAALGQAMSRILDKLP